MIRRENRIYEFGTFRLIPEERRLLRDDQTVPLTPKAFDLLVVLVENSGHLVEKEELMRRIWPDSFVEEANLSVKMSALRRALGEGPNDHQFIETVPRSGYRFIADVRMIEGSSEPYLSAAVGTSNSDIETPDASSSSRPVPPPAQPNKFPRHWYVVPAGLLLVLALGLGFNVGNLRTRLSSNPEVLNIHSLAVLPMENISGDNTQDYFADGMTETLITDLAKVSALRIVPGRSVRKYKDAAQPWPEIAHELKVDALLTGSVLRSGDRIRIAVQLIDVASNRNLWAENYERNVRDILVLQREVARDITTKIRIKLTPQEQSRFENASTVDPKAYDSYLRGRFYVKSQNKDDINTAITKLEEAVAVDPNFASAYAELAQAYTWKFFLFAPKERQWAEKAFVAVENALKLDPDLGVAHLARGRLLWTPDNHFPHEKAIKEYRLALELNPNLDEARNQLALVYCHIGYFDEALRESQKATDTNPTNNLAVYRMAQTLAFQERHEEALTVLHTIPEEVNPALIGSQTAWTLFNLGRLQEASAKIEQLLKDNPEDSGGLFTSVQAIIAASEGKKLEAEEKIKLAIERGKGFGHFHHTAYVIACAYAQMNKHDEAIRWLQSAAEDGFPCYPLFEKDPKLNNLRRNPKFVEWLAKLKGQWEDYRSRI